MNKKMRYYTIVSVCILVVCVGSMSGASGANQGGQTPPPDFGHQRGIGDWLAGAVVGVAGMLKDTMHGGAKAIGQGVEYLLRGNKEKMEKDLAEFKRALDMLSRNDGPDHSKAELQNNTSRIFYKNEESLNLLKKAIQELEDNIKKIDDRISDAQDKAFQVGLENVKQRAELGLKQKLIQTEVRAKGAEDRKTALAAINLITQPENLKKIVLAGGGLAGLTFLSFYGLKLSYGLILERMKPQLVTKTSVNFLGMRTASRPSRMHLFVGNKRLKEDVMRIIKMVTNARTKGGTLGNIVFYGPPGTGKTMMAEEIAIQSGMDYAIFSAGDFGKLSPEEQKIQLEKLFGWSSALVRRGKSLVIFIDEAEEFLRDRRFGNAREGLLSMFLNRVPEQRSKNLMFIFATNFLKQLDGAVLSRIDEAIPFSKPGQKEREQMMLNYLKDDVQKFVGKKGERIALTQEDMNQIAATFSRDEYTKGFVGRNIAGMIALLQDVGLTKGRVTFEDARPILEHKIEREKYLIAVEREKQQKSKFEGYAGTSEEEIAEEIAAVEKQEKNGQQSPTPPVVVPVVTKQ